MEVYPVGSTVVIDGDVEAMVLQILLSQEGTQYKVSWWDGRSRNESWVFACEVQPATKAKKMQIGFVAE